MIRAYSLYPRCIEIIESLNISEFNKDLTLAENAKKMLLIG